MRNTIITLNGYFKGLLFVSRPHIFLGFLNRFFLTLSNTLRLTRWMAKQPRKGILNDFYLFKRNYAKRFQLYEYLVEELKLGHEAFDYFEFGVYGGSSFQWWLKVCSHPESRFFGFDTFEGLPENWGTFKKGAMSAQIPDYNDTRALFFKGLFQDSLPGFLSSTDLNTGKRKVFHLDADLFSSTLFTLTSIAPYLNKGDILLFDEFNVPNHEFFAFSMFVESYYIKTKLIGAVNNYLQVAFIIED
jgi:O-methyltransferase